MAQESRLVIVIDSQNAERNARNLGNELSSIERKGDFASKSTDRMSVATRSLAGYMAGVVTIGSAISKMDLYTGINNKLKLVTNSQEELNQAMDDTFEIAQRSASSWGAVNDVYSKYMSNAKTLNLTQEQTAKLTEITSKAVAISGSNAESASAALFQYGQALDGGVLRAEEFNSLVDGAGGLLNAMAKGLGITRGELRQMMLDGQLTGEVITKALLKAGDSVEELYGKTDKTITQSLEMLSNGITKFVGETGQGSGAAQTLAGSIQILAENLDLIVDSAFVLGIGLMTKAVLTKTIAIQASIVASAQQRAANLAEAQSQVQLLGVEAMRARQSAALALTEIGLARAEYNAAITADARAVAVQRKTAAEIAHSLALKEATAATAAYTVAQGNLNRVASLGSRALSLVGGPIGAITLGITALAAGYMYFQDKADKANKKLEEQAAVAKRAKDELLALRGLEKDSAINDMTSAFERQNKALAESSSKINIQLNAIAQLYKGNKEIVQVVNQAKDGTISMNEAVKRFNELRISRDIYNALKQNSAEFENNAKAAKTSKESLKLFGIEVELSGNKAQTAVAGIDNNSKALIGNESAAQKAAKAQKGYFDSLRNEVLKSNEELALLNLGYSEETVKKILELQKAKQAVAPPGTTAIISKEEMDQVAKAQKALDVLKDKKDELTAAERKHTSELAKQEKITKRLVGVSGQSGIGTGPHLDVRYGGSMSGQKVSNEHLARLQAGGKPLSSYKISSNYGPRQAPTKGASSFHKGIDFSMPEGTPITTNVAVKDIKTRYDSKGGGYVSEVIFEDGVTLKLLHQSPSMQSKVKGGASKGSDKASGDIQSQLDRQQDLQRSLENEVASEVGRINNNRKARLEDVDKANFSPERTAEIKAEINRRADNDIDIAKQALRTKLEDYKEFQKTEEQLLEESFNRKKFNAAHDIELSKSEQKQAVELLEQQYQQENALMKLAQEQRLFQARIFLLSETEAMQERYRLERLEIQKTVKDEEERRKRIALSKSQEQLETLDRATKAGQTWGGVQADMNGTSEFYRQDQERSSRMSSATNFFDSQKGVVNLNEQSSLDSLNAQMEAGLIQQQDYENQKTAIIQAAQEQRNQITSEYAQNSKDIEDKYQQDRLNTQIALGGQMMGSVTSMFGSMFGEQSKAYKLMFAADKAYAIAAAGIAIQQNIAAASKVGFPYNLPLIAGAVAQGASIIANIRAIKDQGFADGGYTGSGGKYEPAGIVHKGEVVWSQEDIKRWGGVGLVENMRKSASPEAFINNHATNNTSAENIFNRSLLSSKAFNDNQSISNIFNQPTRENQIIVNALKPSKDAVSRSGDVQSITNQYAGNNSSFSNVLDKSIQSSKSFTAKKSNLSNLSNSKIQNSNVSNSTVQNAQKELLKEISIFRDHGNSSTLINNHAQNNTSAESIFNRSAQSSKAFNDSRTNTNIFNQSARDNQIIVKSIESKALNEKVQTARKNLLEEVINFRETSVSNPIVVDGSKGFANGGFTGRGKKYDVAGAVHRNEIVWSQDDIRNWGGVEKVEQMRKATSPESFISNYAQSNSLFENIVNRANQSSRAFNQSRDISNIFNQSYQDDRIIYKGNTSAANSSNTANSDLFHDGKVYFSSNGLVQDRSNLEDVQDFTSGQSSRPQAEFMPSIEPSSPTINFKIEVVNQVSGSTVEAEQLDEKTVRIIVKDELDKQLPRTIPKIVGDQIANPNSTISRSLTENTTARRNR
ncbi:tape measure protein [Acinetobacter pittii]|uniref:tape measure protein n=1 Tax=Acinetobacter pittii TaxID=48296 RepID=UPI001D07E9E7|nr:tape measure protein [Acinetobacter pittii]